jgi:hypothetical protein
MIGSQVDSARASQLEMQVLELWDRLYQVWVMSAAANDVKTHGPMVTNDAVISSWDSLVGRLTTTPGRDNFKGVIYRLKNCAK